MSLRGHDKSLSYVNSVYEARCSRNWTVVPELARKVVKYAPGRECLALAAGVSALVNSQPSEAAYQSAEQEYGAPLDVALRSGRLSQIDALDGGVFRAALHLGKKNYAAALASIPDLVHRPPVPQEGAGQEAWAGVCVVFGTFIEGLALEKTRDLPAAASVYRAVLPYMANVVALRSPCAELRRWSEELLSHMGLFFSPPNGSRTDQSGDAMQAFALLSQLVEGNARTPTSSRSAITGVSQRQHWRAYYEALSSMIRNGHVPPSGKHEAMDGANHSDARLRLVEKLVSTEKNYENLLLRETHFPKATETNGEVRGWVELVMDNWRVLCGSSWSDEELGMGGKVGVGRKTLDILYRAATKTFHSTQILRHLFTIHTFLGEFYLAFKAFDTYIAIMSKGKARIAKSGEIDESLDDDDTVLRLAAEALSVACRFNPNDYAERALNIGILIQGWIEQAPPDSLSKNQITQHDAGVRSPSRNVLSIAYHAIGISQANWALVHYDASVRTEFQQKAIHTLQKSLKIGGTQNESVETLFALGYMLANMRDIPGATTVLKRALQTSDPLPLSSSPDGLISGRVEESKTESHGFAKERKLLAVWHFLALLISTEDEYEKAAACCEAAFDQFQDPVNLFGMNPESRSKRALVAGDKMVNQSERGIVDEMSNFEKQNIIELKMTHMALLNELEGPEVAVNESDELIALYLRLYGSIRFESSNGQPSYSTSTSAHNASNTQRITFDGTQSSNQRVSRETPTIEITNEKGASTHGPSHHHFGGHKHDGQEGHKHFGSLRSKVGSMRRPRASGESRRSNNGEKREFVEPRSGETPTQPLNGHHLDGMAHNMSPETLPEPLKNTTTPLRQDTRLPAPAPDAHQTPTPHFVILQQRCHHVSVLIKIWLYIAALYTEASMPHDANEAIQEACKLVENLELEVSRKDSSVKAFQQRGWGLTQSIEELWACVYTKRGLLLQTQARPHHALQEFEEALSHSPDHPEAIVALSGLLLDIYEQAIPPEQLGQPRYSQQSSHLPAKARELTSSLGNAMDVPSKPPHIQTSNPSPEELSRLAARDRAYGLLSSLTKSAKGWHDSEAWLTLSRAHELSGQVAKAKEALWWTLELENVKPIRPWSEVGPGGLVL